MFGLVVEYKNGVHGTIENVPKNAMCSQCFQNVLLLINAILVGWYLCETRKMRKAAEDQVGKSQSQISATYEQLESMREQIAIAHAQREAQIRPALTIIGRGATLWVVNVGSGPALNLQIVKGRNQTIVTAGAEVETTFGIRLRGSFVVPGEQQAKDTGEKIGSHGQVMGDDLQLVYESLSGKKYISLIEFDGPGNLNKTSFTVPRNSQN